MPTSSTAPVPAAPVRVTGWIERHRRIWFGLVGLLLILSFNGQWQIGPDSAAYRGLGHSLATTGKYFFREKVPGLEDYADQQGTRYPGLPIILAGLEKLFGRGDLPPLLFMSAVVILLLVLTYRLMLYRVPRWLAVAVIVGMGTNARFLQYSNEILTDIPFLLGLVIAMLGYERLIRANGKRELAIAGALLLGGFLVSASMRPTFLFLAVAVVGACVWGLIAARPGIARDFGAHIPPAGPVARWKFAVLLGALAVAAATFLVAIDVRSKHGFLGGGYESHVFGRLDKLTRLWPEHTHEMLESALPVAFYGSRIGPGLVGPKPAATDELTRQKRARRTIGGVLEPPKETRYGFGTLYSLVLIAASLWLAKRNVLWGLLAGVTIASYSITGAVPRYFIMLLPLLLAAWGLFGYGAARWLGRFGGATFADLTLLAALGAVVGINLFVAGDYIFKQRGLTRPIDLDANDHYKWQGIHHVGYLSVYHHGIWHGVYDLAAMVRDHTKPGQKLLGPEATVLTYLTDRQVYFPMVAEVQRVQSGRGAESFFKLALISVDPKQSRFEDYDKFMKQLAAMRVVVTGRVVAGPVDGYELVEFQMVPPHPRGPRRRAKRAAATQPGGASSTPPATTPARSGRRGRPATQPG